MPIEKIVAAHLFFYGFTKTLAFLDRDHDGPVQQLGPHYEAEEREEREMERRVSK